MADENFTSNLNLTSTDNASGVIVSAARRVRESLKEYERAVKDVAKAEKDANSDAVKYFDLLKTKQDAWAKLQRAQSAQLAEDTVKQQDKKRREIEKTAEKEKKAAADAAEAYRKAGGELGRYASQYLTIGAAIDVARRGFMAFADSQRGLGQLQQNLRLNNQELEKWKSHSKELSAIAGQPVEELNKALATLMGRAKLPYEEARKQLEMASKAAVVTGTGTVDWVNIQIAALNKLKIPITEIPELLNAWHTTVPAAMVPAFAGAIDTIGSELDKLGVKIDKDMALKLGATSRVFEGVFKTPDDAAKALSNTITAATNQGTNFGKMMAANLQALKDKQIDYFEFVLRGQKLLEEHNVFSKHPGEQRMARAFVGATDEDIKAYQAAALNIGKMREELGKTADLNAAAATRSRDAAAAIDRLTVSAKGAAEALGEAADAAGGTTTIDLVTKGIQAYTKLQQASSLFGMKVPMVTPAQIGSAAVKSIMEGAPTAQSMEEKGAPKGMPWQGKPGGRIPGFATGGEFMVGGSGGTDTQPVGFMATPGEQVSIDPQGGMKESLKVQQDKADLALREHFARFHRSDRARQASLAGDLGGMYDAKGKYTGKGGPGGGGGGGGGGGDPAAGTRTGTGSGTGGGGGNQASGTGPADTGLKTPVGLDPASSTGPAESLEEAYKRGYLKPPGSGGVAGATNPYLAQARAPYFEELDKNPALKTTVMKIMASELGGTGLGASGVLESMIDRSRMAGHKSLQQAISSGFYGPVNRGEVARRGLSAKERADAEAMMARVRAGSRDIGLRTDQGQQWEHWADKARGIEREGKTKIGGEWFSFHNKKWSDEEMRKADESLRTAGQAPVGTSTAPSTTTTTDLKQSLIGAPEGTGGSPYPMTGGASARGAEKSWSNMTPEMRGRMAALYQSAPPEIQKQLSIHSGWRSLQTQAALHAGPHTAPVAAPTPNAPHVRGDAADMTFATPEARAWVHANAGKYGLHFPMAVEPWHIQVNPAFKGSLAGRDAKPATPVDTAAIEQRAAARYKQAEDRARIITAPTAPAGDTDDGIQGSRAAGKNLGPDVTPGIRPFGRTFRQEARRVRNLPYAAPAGEGRAAGKGIAAKPIVVRPVSAEGHEEKAAGKGPRPASELAGGGTAGAGQDVLVGEGGPEVVRMGPRSGRVESPSTPAWEEEMQWHGLASDPSAEEMTKQFSIHQERRAQLEKPIEPIIRPRIQNMGPASMRWTRHAERNRDQDNTRRAARESHVDLGFA